MVSALSGCGGKEALRVGTEASFPPFETVGDDNKIIGFDIDIINFIAEDNGWDIVVINRSFDTLVDALAADELDIVIAGMTITPGRAEKVLFSQPYYNASQVMVVREDERRNFGLGELADLGLVVAVQTGTTGFDEAVAVYGSEAHPNIRQYDWAIDAFKQMKNGWADVVIIDKPVAESYIGQLGGMKIHGQPFTDEQFGIAVQKNATNMMAKIDASLSKLVTSGEYDVIFDKWFGD